MSPPRIALIRQRYTAFGGAERFVAGAMAALEKQGASISIITRRWPPADQRRAIICNPFYLGGLWRDCSFAHCVHSILQKEKFDLVQSHERIVACDIYRAGDGVHREWLRQRRRILGLSGRLGIALNPHHHYLLAAEKRLFASPQLRVVICNSQMVKAEIQEWFGLPEDKLVVIHSGVDTKIFHPNLRRLHRVALRQRLGISLDVPVFVFVGSGFERKGLASLLYALARLTRDAHLLIVGRDKRSAAFQALAARLQLLHRIHFLGGQEDVKPCYGAADVFVLPTLYDPFPNAALEAFACGLPVITSTKSGAAELVRPGHNGFVCDALDDTTLALLMTKSLDFSTAESSAARATVAHLTQERMAKELISLYHHLLRS
ncbi:UDP-glucose:(heptosyl)LPS alpha-1,3-glucosyltransferase [Gammaproteobacteria bacterium]